jgi:ABC-type sugar transport system permease subunit
VKLFDLIYVLTAGGPGVASRTIAFVMYREALASRNFSYGAAVAVVMLVVLTPVMVFNVRRFRADRVVQ